MYYRGTDKWLELSPIPPHYYILEIQRLLAKDDDLRVLIQTDQEQVRNECVKSFGDRAFFFDELPVASSLTGLHHVPPESRGISNYQFGVSMLAAANIMAKCRYVVTSTCTVGLWILLYRGTAKNTAQFRPQAPELITNYTDKVERLSTTTACQDEIYDLRTENTQLRLELREIRNSTMYRCMKFSARQIDRLFPDNTKRGQIRIQVIEWLMKRGTKRKQPNPLGH